MPTGTVATVVILVDYLFNDGSTNTSVIEIPAKYSVDSIIEHLNKIVQRGIVIDLIDEDGFRVKANYFTPLGAD